MACTAYTTHSHLYDDGKSGLLIILSFSTVPDWPSRHRTNVKVSRWLLHTVILIFSKLLCKIYLLGSLVGFKIPFVS